MPKKDKLNFFINIVEFLTGISVLLNNIIELIG